MKHTPMVMEESIWRAGQSDRKGRGAVISYYNEQSLPRDCPGASSFRGGRLGEDWPWTQMRAASTAAGRASCVLLERTRHQTPEQDSPRAASGASRDRDGSGGALLSSLGGPPIVSGRAGRRVHGACAGGPLTGPRYLAALCGRLEGATRPGPARGLASSTPDTSQFARRVPSTDRGKGEGGVDIHRLKPSPGLLSMAWARPLRLLVHVSCPSSASP